eukprot:7197832-Prymnesium_polylepis.1
MQGPEHLQQPVRARHGAVGRASHVLLSFTQPRAVARGAWAAAVRVPGGAGRAREPRRPYCRYKAVVARTQYGFTRFVSLYFKTAL